MIFTETAFLVFIAAFLPLHYLTRRWFTLNKSIVLVASYLFYGWADWRFTILLFASSVVDYYCALQLFNSRSHKARSRWLVSGITFSLSLLGFFKYGGLIAITVNALASNLQSGPLLPVLQIALPAGISFYTFQSMSYLIDVHRGTLSPSRSLYTYLLYVSYFPQLVAGPIERATHLLPQFYAPRQITPAGFADGCRQILAGYFMKTVVADNLAPFVDGVYRAPGEYTAPMLGVATFFFGLQIYFDFAGYSNIAIGLGKLMGFEIMQNFRTPYFACSLQDFWRRWHISLSTFFRDYLYIPLGGSRLGLHRTLLNLVLVFTISGLWHGANWTFVMWGFYHGLGLAVALLTIRLFNRLTPFLGRAIFGLVAFIATQLYVMLGWIFFRAQSLSEAHLIWSRLLDPSSWNPNQLHLLHDIIGISVVTAALLAVEFFQRDRSHFLDLDRLPRYLRHICYLIVLASIPLLGSGSQAQFIYFRF